MLLLPSDVWVLFCVVVDGRMSLGAQRVWTGSSSIFVGRCSRCCNELSGGHVTYTGVAESAGHKSALRRIQISRLVLPPLLLPIDSLSPSFS